MGVVAVAIDQGGYPQSCRAVETSWQFLLEMIRIRHNTVSTVENALVLNAVLMLQRVMRNLNKLLVLMDFFL